MTKRPQLKQDDGYKQAAERLVVLLAASQHQVEELEKRLEKQIRPRYAVINLAKSIDSGLLHLLGMSSHSLAHIVPEAVTELREQDIATMSPGELATIVAAYDSRFSEAEQTNHLRRPKETIGLLYRAIRGTLLRTVIRIGHALKGRR